MDLCGRVRRFFEKRTSSRAGARGAKAFSPVALSLAILAVAMSVRLGWPPAAYAQDQPTQDLPKPSEVVKIGMLKLVGTLKPGATSQLGVEAEILSGWHINSNHPNSADFIPTVLSVNPPAGLKAGAIKYPPADEIAPAFSGGEKLSVFTGTMSFTATLNAAPGFKPDSGAKFVVTLEYQPCNDNICMPPAKVSASASLGSLQAAAAVSSPRAVLERARLVAVAFGNGDGDSSADSSDVSPDNGGTDASGSQLGNIFVVHGMLIGLLAVLLGGLALNLTPCVYPLIGVTIAYFGNQGGGPRKITVLAIIYVLGIALTFSLAGVAVALSGGLFGAALQNPLVLIAIAAMLLGLAGSSFGLFSLKPPQWLMRRAGMARPGYLGSLVMGLGMGVVAAPCIGPIVLGLLLMVERSASPVFGFVLFFTLAIGLGLPYIALALAAGHIKALPRSGEWLAWVEQLFGFVLVGLALYFLDPVMRGWAMRIMPYYAPAAGIFLGFMTPAGRQWRPFLVFRSALGALSLGALVWLILFPAAKPARQLAFDPYDVAILNQARAAKRPVVIDFSADWCIPCREMLRTTFRDPAVIEAASHFVRLQADVTETNRRTRQLSLQYEIKGVPTTVFIDKHGRILKREVGYLDAHRFLSDLREVDEMDGLPEVRATPPSIYVKLAVPL
ncbi:MAG TPA: cytochrome c biogenesis protein CcdA [Candidatus Binataceae bacterium]|nr:cytochrome c biogenesis protein CcdA [Candidatus Binataceae bacterium]